MAITPVSELVARAKRQITSYAPEVARDLVEAEEARLVDIRDPRELARDGRVPGAIHAPRGMLEFWVDPDSPYHKPVLATDATLILFCASSWRSALAAKALADMGVERVAEVEGGFNAWSAAGLPVERDA